MHPLLNRKGLTSSEFWLLVLYFGTAILNGTEHVTISAQDMAILAGLVGGYGVGRVGTKFQLARDAVNDNTGGNLAPDPSTAHRVGTAG